MNLYYLTIYKNCACKYIISHLEYYYVADYREIFAAFVHVRKNLRQHTLFRVQLLLMH